ncbi:hypothetical protein E2C01_031085 [Portunus trituberculatus]|uniref:Uncharacterized protein n=1 Tax=Portunus trituberculatus TaxID=210409 RepID=A0A5B7EX54_PORTR|nr:hypothetical protein [Portunus trituberculatus]
MQEEKLAKGNNVQWSLVLCLCTEGVSATGEDGACGELRCQWKMHSPRCLLGSGGGSAAVMV